MQEFYALLIAHAAIRGLMSAAAIRTDQASVDLSLVHTGRGLLKRTPWIWYFSPIQEVSYTNSTEARVHARISSRGGQPPLSS